MLNVGEFPRVSLRLLSWTIALCCRVLLRELRETAQEVGCSVLMRTTLAHSAHVGSETSEALVFLIGIDMLLENDFLLASFHVLFSFFTMTLENSFIRVAYGF